MAAAKPTGGAAALKRVPDERPGTSRQIIDEAQKVLAQSQAAGPEVFRDPLAFVEDDHVRQIRMCNVLDAFSGKFEAEPVKTLAGALLEFMKGDLPLHTEDEEHDLIPALRWRCRPDDEIDEVLRRMTREHELDRDLRAFLVDDLEALADGRNLNNPVRLRTNVREFSELLRQHVTWENRVVLPVARKRLTAEDLAEIGRSMAARRGLAGPD